MLDQIKYERRNLTSLKRKEKEEFLQSSLKSQW
jgi:hypothetical protein